MRADRSLRLPLQIGTSALLSLARGSLLAVPGLILATAALAFVVIYLPDMGDLSGYLLVILATPGLTALVFARKHLRRAHAERPSDLLVDPKGFSIDGGPHHGSRVEWTEIARVAIETPPKPPKGSDKQDDSDQRVMQVVFNRGAKEVSLTLASAEREGEQASLRELARTVEAASSKPEATPPTAAKPVNLLACAGCGAALAPVDAMTAKCPYCEHETSVADELRTQIRDGAAVQARPDAAITKLLDQPGATFVGTLFVSTAGFMLVAWPLAIVLMLVEYHARSLSFTRVLSLIGFVATSIAGLYALIRGRLVDRQALRLVAVEYAAVEPEKPGDPYRCQRCVAPLPAAVGDRVVIRCVYCNADNVLGLHLGRQASVAREESRSLEEALVRRKHERRRWRGITVVAIGLLALAWWSLQFGFAV